MTFATYQINTKTKSKRIERMLILLKLFEILTIVTVKTMFHLWYLWGTWLSSYITIDDERNGNPYVFSFPREQKWHPEVEDKLEK